MEPEPSPLAISSESFDDYYTSVQAAALKSVRSSASLPSDISFSRSLDLDFANDLDQFASRVLSITNNLLELAAIAKPDAHAVKKPKLETQDDVLDRFQALVVHCMDGMLEGADTSLDRHLGRIKPPAIKIAPPPPPPQKKIKVSTSRLDPALAHASHLPKPQLSFTKKPDNLSSEPWHPTLKHKFNAQVPLGYVYHEPDVDSARDVDTLSLHPYFYEIKHISYPSRMFHSSPPTLPRSFDNTPFTWVDTLKEFSSMLDKLRLAKEIAIDLEHHHYRSFGGFVCLMQVSTREEDWIVDTLILREELTELNEVFTNPNILKVFHGAESDIIWLQQDFNLYIVNLFDTYHASKVLDFQRHGLANLLETYCDFTPDKKYQMADWRIRPLPEEMLQYARSDTHYLLYIYDNLRNAILEREESLARSSETPTEQSTSPLSPDAHPLMRTVLSRSEDTSLRTYVKEIYDADGGTGIGGWYALAKKWNKGAFLVDGAPQNIYRAIHYWRDRVAREEDESTAYVLPNHYVLELAERAPADMPSLISNLQRVPPIVRRRGNEILDAIKMASVEDVPRTDLSNSLASAGNKDGSFAAMEIQTESHAVQSNSAFASSSYTPASGVLSSYTPPPTIYWTTSSKLFGGPMVKSSVTKSKVENIQFRDIVSRIHSTLVLAPSALKIATESAKAQQDSETSNVAPVDPEPESELGMQIEIPFIPAAQRQIAKLAEDSIVVVGQVRQKKRKRPKQQADTPGLDASSAPFDTLRDEYEATAKDAGSQEPFDFSSVPNVLDDAPRQDTEVKPRKKKKQKGNQNGVLEYGNFPAPPRAHRETKSGNQSQTFR